MIKGLLESIGLLFVIAQVFFSIQVFGSVSSCQKILGADRNGREMCEKIGQMLIVGFGGFSQDEASGEILWNDKEGAKFSKSSLVAKHIADDHIGGVILFAQAARDVKTGEFIRDRNIQNPAQVAKLNQDLQNYSNQTRKEQGLLSLPLFISVDQEGGRIDRMPASQGFPVRTLIPQALGAKEEGALGFSGDWLSAGLVSGLVRGGSSNSATQETYAYAKRLAQEVFDANFNLNFAPVVDVNIDPTNSIIGGLGRSFSSNPQVVVDQAQQFVRAFNEVGIISALKHFPGHGSSAGDSHDGLVDVTKTYNKADELYPYFNLISDGHYKDIVMTTHVINGVIDNSQCKVGLATDPSTWCPGTMSKKTLTDLLRNEMGFKGLIVSDDMTMGAIAKQYPLKVFLEKGVNAGVDMFVIANNKADLTDEVIIAIAELVKEGAIKREKIREAYVRITSFKKSRLLKN